jgi:hypothetical protein
MEKVFQEKSFYDLILSKKITDDQNLRRLNEVVGLSFVRRPTAPFYGHTGQPSIDPVVFVKMMLPGCLYGMTSKRKRATECGLNLAFCTESHFYGIQIGAKLVCHYNLGQSGESVVMPFAEG